MFVRVASASLWGVDALDVAVEIFRGQGLPGVSLVGLARGATRESWVRVRAALGQLGISASGANLVVNLVPADRPKDASTLELALAVAVGVAAGKVRQGACDQLRFWGEVGLDGRLVSSPGGLLVADLARRRGDAAVILPHGQASQAALLGGVTVLGARHLEDVLDHLSGRRPLAPVQAPPAPQPGGAFRARKTVGRRSEGQSDGRGKVYAGAGEISCSASRDGDHDNADTEANESYHDSDNDGDHDHAGFATEAATAAAADAPSATFAPCLRHVVGQPQARLALEVAAAGGHHLLLVGPPGSGKTMLARALVGLLPPPDGEALAEVLRVRAAQLGAEDVLSLADLTRLPYRSPHHTSTVAALLGGGAPLQIGELTRAHRGLLFLDELAEFPRRTLEALREPLEEGAVHLSRHGSAARLPAQVLLVAAANPCPCGYYVPPDEPSESLEEPALALATEFGSNPRIGTGAAAGGALAAGATPSPRASVGLARACVCDFRQVTRYRARLSGPLLERIDLHVRTQPVDVVALTRGPPAGAAEVGAVVRTGAGTVDDGPAALAPTPVLGESESSATVARRVAAARALQAKRQGSRLNAQLRADELARLVPMGGEVGAALARGCGDGTSMRRLDRVRKVARTLADLRGAERVAARDVLAALPLARLS